MGCKNERDEIVGNCKKGHFFCMEDKCPDYEPIDYGNQE